MEKPKKVIDLTHTLHSAIPGWDGDCGFRMSLALDYGECAEPYLFRKHAIATPSGVGTHIDAPAHCTPGGKTVEALDIDDLVTDCVVIAVDASEKEEYILTPEAIQKFEEQHGKIQPNTFVLFQTGWSTHWETPEKYINNHSFPSVSGEAAALLLERNIAGLGIDTLSADTGKNGFPVHKAILGAGKYLVENIANGESLPATGAKVFVLPMKIRDAAEAPVRVVVIT